MFPKATKEAGVLAVTFMFSYSAVILTGELSEYVPRLTGQMLFGAVVISLIVGLFSQFRGVVALPQDNPTAVIAVMIVAISEVLGSAANPEILFLHATVIIVLSTFIAGILFVAIGHWKVATSVQYVPYPVVAGFLAGTGWLLFKGSFGVMADVVFNFTNLSPLFRVAYLWLPGAVFAITVMYATRKFTHFLVMPGLIIGVTFLFHLVLVLSGTSTAEAIRQGWLLAPFGDAGLWQPLSMEMLGSFKWATVIAEFGGIGTILIIAIISVLLNLTALESALGREIDVNKEMKLVGVSN